MVKDEENDAGYWMLDTGYVLREIYLKTLLLFKSTHKPNLSPKNQAESASSIKYPASSINCRLPITEY
jgi:hypothetical protein